MQELVNRATFSTSKAGMDPFTRYIAIDASKGVRVKAVNPGPIHL